MLIFLKFNLFMIYINNELVANKDQKSTNGQTQKGFGNGWEDFCEIFKDHLNPNKTINSGNPIVIKYVDALIVDDKDNPGKKIMPPSVVFSYVARTSIDGSGVEVRFSPNPPQKLQNGEFKWTVEGEDVYRGHLSITDVDKAFFFWKYSMQNEANDFAPENGKVLKIQNVALERRTIALKKQTEATLNARLWNEIKDGGLNDEKIREVASHFMLKGVNEKTDINEVKIHIESAIKNKPSLKDEFLRLTDVVRPDDAEIAARKAIVNKAIELDIIANDRVGRKFNLLSADGKVVETLFTYPKNTKPEDAKIELFSHLQENSPEVIDAIKERIEAANLAVA